MADENTNTDQTQTSTTESETEQNPSPNPGPENDQTPADKQVDQGTGTDTDTNDQPVSSDDNTSTEGSAAPTNNSQGTPMTSEEYIRTAPPEIQAVLNEGLRLHNSKKAALVSGLKSNSRCEYTEEELQKMDLRDLERLAKLADVPSYEGIAPASQPRTNAADENRAPMPLEAFPRKVAEAS